MKSSKVNWQAIIYRNIEPSAWGKEGISPLNRLIIALIVGAVLLAVVETEASLSGHYQSFFNASGVFFASVFLIEFALRVMAAGQDPRYAGLSGRIRFTLTFWSLVDILAFAPFFVTLGSDSAFIFRIARLLRILRIARLGRFSNAWNAIYEAFALRRIELALASGMALLLLIISSALLYVIEAEAQPEAFGSIPRVMWWSIATLTTVGYGDVTPITTAGKFVAGITAFSAIGLIALPTGILAATFSDALQRYKT